MKEKEMKIEKYIRKDDPVLDESVDYLNYLIDAYKQTSDLIYRDALLDAFDDYFRKYVSIMHGKGSGVDINNADTKNFLRLFMKKEDRLTHAIYMGTVGSYIHMLRRALLGFTAEDLYHEIIVIFLELVEKYKTITYKRGEKNYRISFAHYIQVNTRFKLCKWIIKKSQDVLTGRDWLEFKEGIHEDVQDTFDPSFQDEVSITLKDWVWGDTSTAPFSGLTEMERYLIWLRYEGDPEGKKLSTREISVITGYHQRSIIYKLKKIKVKLGRSS